MIAVYFLCYALRVRLILSSRVSMVEVSDDQHAILGIDQFDHRVHTLNKWIKSRGEAALALGVEINGIELYA